MICGGGGGGGFSDLITAQSQLVLSIMKLKLVEVHNISFVKFCRSVNSCQLSFIFRPRPNNIFSISEKSDIKWILQQKHKRKIRISASHFIRGKTKFANGVGFLGGSYLYYQTPV